MGGRCRRRLGGLVRGRGRAPHRPWPSVLPNLQNCKFRRGRCRASTGRYPCGDRRFRRPGGVSSSTAAPAAPYQPTRHAARRARPPGTRPAPGTPSRPPSVRRHASRRPPPGTSGRRRRAGRPPAGARPVGAASQRTVQTSCHPASSALRRRARPRCQATATSTARSCTTVPSASSTTAVAGLPACAAITK